MPDEAASQPTDDFTRLHITPLDADLLKIILPASVAAQARNISYHTIETFPERRYGFIEVPNMDAEKIKKKLNGSVLKGAKVRVEKARPEERMEPTGEEDKAEKKKKKSKDKTEGSKKRKRDPEVIDGVVLTDRKVKRGWTEPAEHRRKKSKKDKDKEGKTTEKKKRIKSKYTDQEECLLKMKLPPNHAGNVTEDNLPKKRKKKGKGREITVHEFEKTTKFPSFLKASESDSKTKQATEFVAGKGWVDEDGDVVETDKTKPVSTPKPKKRKAKPVIEEKPVPVEADDDDDSTSSSGTSSSGTSSDEEESEDEEEAQNKTSISEQNDSPTHHVHATPLSAIKSDASRPASSSSARSLTIKIPPPITPSTTKVHPLEALYKRNAKPEETPVQGDEPFSFFSGANNDDDIDDAVPALNVPMTPFTRQDFESRTTRSAAPTPDTAHPSRMKNFWAQEDGEEMDDVDDAPEGMLDDAPEEATADEGQKAGTSDFQSWFWENRRDLNQSWMKRRKTAAKEKRHRENKARASRAV